MVQVNVKIPTRFGGILTNQTGVIGFINRRLKRFTFPNILTTNIDVTGIRIHREGGNQTAFNQSMRIMAHDLTVFAGAGL